MKLHPHTYCISLLLFLISCTSKNDIYESCKISTENLTQVEYGEAMNNWMDCLVSERIKEKSKKELYNDIKGNHIEGIYIGYEGKLSDSFLSSMALSKILTDDELKENIKSSDPGIKFFSFRTIAKKKDENVFNMLKALLNDTTTISTHFGCVSDRTTVADLCIDLVTKVYVENIEDYQPSHYQLNLEEKRELDSLILNSDNKLKYRVVKK